MKKKICLALALCLILSLISGCGAKKLEPFGMTITDLNKKINENIEKMGYDTTVPEFKEEKKDNRTNYTCDVSEDLNVSVMQYSDGTYYIIVLMMFPLSGTTGLVDNFRDFVAVTFAIASTVDPDADIQDIANGLKMSSLDKSSLSFQTDQYTYESDTSVASKTFVVTKK